MTIRPVEFNGMIQNTQEASNLKANEDNKATLQQQNVQVAVTQQEQASQSTVRQMENADHHEYNYEEGADGTGYDASGRRKKRKPQQKKMTEDGRVIQRGEQPSFDIKI